MEDIQQPAPQPQKKHTGLIVILSLVVLLALFAGGGAMYYYNGPCGISRVEKAGSQLTEQLQQFGDAYNVASSTSRIALSGPVGTMQSIQRDTEEIEVPACLETAKSELVQSMDTAVQGFLAFMSQQEDYVITKLMKESTDHITAFGEEIKTVQECKPFCR